MSEKKIEKKPADSCKVFSQKPQKCAEEISTFFDC